MAAPKEASGSSIVTSGSSRSSTPRPGRFSRSWRWEAGAHDICISEKAGKAYITAEADNAVTTVDLETLAKGSIPVGPLPHHIEPSHDGRSIFVTLASHPMTVPPPGTPAFATIDTDDNSVTYTATSANPAARAHAVFPTPDGDRMFVAHDTGNEVSGVDVETGDIFLSVSPIVRAEEVVATRFGDQLWVSSRGDGTRQAYRHCDPGRGLSAGGIPPLSTRVGHADAERAHAGGEHARHAGRTGIRRYGQARADWNGADRPGGIESAIWR